MNPEATEMLVPLPESPVLPDAAETEAQEERRKKEKKKKKVGSERGIETMFRTSYQMHVDMSALADSKANILISINGLIISVLLAAIAPKVAANPWLLLPTAVVLVGCLISMTFAILAARPRLSPESAASASGGVKENGNLMFFGSFVSLSLQDYEAGVLELMQTRDRLYKTMIRDIYGLGKVLERKFALLRRAYTIFLGGLVSGVVLYLIVYLAMVLLDFPAATF